MEDPSSPVIFLSGAGGGVLDPTIFQTGVNDVTRFITIEYPGWSHYVRRSFSIESMIDDLVSQIVKIVPRGGVRLVGFSIGGHFAYAIGLRLQANGREVGGFCAIDTFMTTSSAPTAGWLSRALARAWELLRKRRIDELVRFGRSRLARTFLRLAGSHLPMLFRRFAPSGQLPSLLTLDPIVESELSMRLLIRAAAPWLASLDREPSPLFARTVLLRTPLTASDDAAWDLRCPGIKVVQMTGDHQTLLEPENICSLREAFISATRDWFRVS
jgi:thioesterase domain-containing protein